MNASTECRPTNFELTLELWPYVKERARTTSFPGNLILEKPNNSDDVHVLAISPDLVPRILLTKFQSDF